MFIGYAQNSTIYRFLVLEDKNKVFDLNTIIESKNAEFFESIFPKKVHIDTTLPQVDLQSNSSESSNIELRRNKRIRKATDFGGDFYVFLTLLRKL